MVKKSIPGTDQKVLSAIFIVLTFITIFALKICITIDILMADNKNTLFPPRRVRAGERKDMLKSFFSRSHELLGITCGLIGMFLLVKSVDIYLGIAGDPSDFWYYFISASLISLISHLLFLHAESIENNESGSNSKDLEKQEELGNNMVANQNKNEDTDTGSILAWVKRGLKNIAVFITMYVMCHMVASAINTITAQITAQIHHFLPG